MSDESGFSAFNDALLDSLLELVVVIDADGRIRWANNAWTSSAISRGATLKTVSPGASYVDVLKESALKDHTVAAILDGITAVLAGTKEWFEQEYECADQNGVRHFVERVTPLKHPDGGAVIAHLDITNQKLAERERDAQRLELARSASAAALGLLSGAIAHELRQPLTAILANAQIARVTFERSGLSGELAATLEDIEKSSVRASSILGRIRDLLSHRQPRREVVDVNDVIEKILPLCRRELAEHAIRLTLSLHRDLPPVIGDPVGLQQVMLNLIVNAYEAMKSAEAKERRLEITTRGADSKCLSITVADNGPGLDKKAIDKLYEPFFSTKADGMGLGLSISRSIIEAHDGTLSITSPAAGGIVAQITLPISTQIGSESQKLPLASLGSSS